MQISGPDQLHKKLQGIMQQYKDASRESGIRIDLYKRAVALNAIQSMFYNAIKR